MAITYYLDSVASDLTGGVDWSVALQRTQPAAGSLATSVKAGATDTEYAWTPSGDPGTNGTSTGTFTVTVNVTVASANMNLAVSVARVNSAGTVQAGDISLGASQSLGTTGTKTFSISNPALGTWNAGDRLRVAYAFTSTSAHGTDSCTIATGDPNSRAVTPFVLVTNWTENPPADDAGLVDSVGYDQGHGFTDDAGLADAATSVVGHSLVLTDSGGLADASTFGGSHVLTLTDDTGLTDSGLLDGLDGLVYDDLAISDSVTTQISQGQFYTPSFTDSAGLVDAATAVAAHVQSITDSVGSTDSALAIAAHQISATDDAGLGDSASPSAAHVVSAVDGVGNTDSAIAVAAHQIASADDAGLTDGTVLNQSKTQADSTGLIDTVTVAADHRVNSSDDAGLSDSLSRGTGLTITDDTGASDSIVESGSGGSVFPDDAGLSDVAAITQAKVSTDEEDITDGLLINLGRAVPTTDAAGLFDAVGFAQAKVFTDSSGLSDQASHAEAEVRSLTDVAGLSDALAYTQAKGRTDNSGAVDSTLLAVGRARPFTDTQGLSDTVAIEQDKVLLDSTALQDQAGLVEAEARQVTDDLDLSDEVVFDLQISLDDNQGLDDTWQFDQELVTADDTGSSDVWILVQERQIDDTVDLFDNHLIEHSQAIDTENLSDSVVIEVDFNLTMVDGVGLSDLADAHLTKGEVVLSGMYQTWDGYPVFGTIRLIPSKPQYVRFGTVRALTDLALEVEHGRVSITVPVGEWTWTVVQQVAGVIHTSVIQPTDDLALSSLFTAGIPNGTAIPATIVDMGDWQSEWAWDTRGWTNQQAYPDLSSQNTDNPPLVLPSVNVTGTFEDAYGKGAGGTVFAEPSVRVITYQDKVFTLPVLREEMQNGQVNFKIPVGNWDWKFTIRVGPTTDVYTVTAPSTDIDLATLVV